MAVKDTVETAINDNKVAVFSKSYCPYSRRAKALFAEQFPSVDVKVLELDEIEDGRAVQDYLLEKTGQSTVPNIFINQKHVGGNDTVQSLNKQGALARLVGV